MRRLDEPENCMRPPELGYVLRMFPQTSETFIANEILELERLGVPIRLYSYRRPREVVTHECVRRIRATVGYLPDPLYRHPWKLFQANRALRRLEPARYHRTLRYVLTRSFKDSNPDIWRRFLQAAYLASVARNDCVMHLHAHFAHRVTQVAMLASMLTGVPFSFTAHAKDIYTARPVELREKIKAAKFVVTCTRANHEYLQRLVETEQRHKVKLRYHGIDVAKFSPAEQKPLTQRPLILSVGRLVAKKGFPYLLHACRILKDKGHAFRALIIGEGPERRALGKMVSALDLQDVVALPGLSSQEELLDIYRRATLFTLPCKVLENGDRDGIPNVLLEAMAVKLPVVSSAISAIPELIQSGHNGLLVSEGDVEGLASAMELLLQDGALREQLGRNGRLTVTRSFDVKTNAQRLAELFGEGPLGQLQQSETSVIRES